MKFLLPAWDAPAGIRACVTTREEGASEGPWARGNLATHVGDDAAAVAHNRAALAAALGLAAAPRWLDQVHGVRCVDAAQVDIPVAADAAFTRTRGVVCAVLTADCLPILLCDRRGGAVAAVHAGWRGLYDGVIGAALAALRAPASALLAWIGPGIGRDAYAVGAELRERFVARDTALANCFERRGDAWHADLAAMAVRQLQAAGVQDITPSGICTHADPRFYSFRRDAVTGRFASLIWID